MAEAFKMKNISLTTVEATIYTCPTQTTAIMFFGQVANSDGSNTADVTIFATDDSATSKKYLARTIPIPADAATTFLTGRLVLEANDTVSGLATANDHLDVTISVLEIS